MDLDIVFNSIFSWACAVCEVFICYCFIDRITGSSLTRQSKYYVAVCSFLFGTIDGVNRNTSELLSWIMLLAITAGICVSLLIKNYNNGIFKFSLVLTYNVCLGLLQLAGAFLIFILFPNTSIDNIYNSLSLYRNISYGIALIIIIGGYRWISLCWNGRKLRDIYKWGFLFYGIAGIFFIIIFQSRILELGRDRGIESIVFLLLVLSGGGLMIVGSLKNAAAKAKMEILEYRDSMMEENYKEIQSIYKNYAYTYHDFKNHLLVLLNYCEKGETGKAYQYIKNLEEPIEKVHHLVRLGNEVLDIILNYKLENAIDKGIEIKTDIGALDEMGIEAHDLCSIISNLLDNAIEACERMSGEEKQIHITIKNLEDIVIIKVSNTYCPPEKWTKTEKENNKLHGYGKQAVKDKVKKYGGDVKFISDEKWYHAIVTFCRE